MEDILSNINSPADLRGLSSEQLTHLAGQIRQRIKATVSANGGHLASNLGVTELTIALHTVFDFYRDRIVWDVGHQCYVHKMLTGRADRFDSLRQRDGLSGFPSPAESDADQFYTGHAGSAVATALGLALGAQAQQSDEKVVAVVGDASIVNGLSFEGLNNTNLLKRQMLVILNDNDMAIDKTEGAFARYLTQVRVSRPYEDLHRRTRLLVRRLPGLGDRLHQTLHRLKGGVKAAMLGNQIFEQLNIPYFGPVDGHDLPALIELLTAFKDVDHPVLLHVQTEKGHGFAPASEDPTTFHSPSPFSVDGETASFPTRSGKSFTAAFAESLTDAMRRDPHVVALTAAMPDGTGLAAVRKEFPDRILDVGIAESAAVDIAAGMAKTGMKPVVAIYSTFLQRGFDQVFQEVSLQNLPVAFCMDRAGMVGGDGAVHHGFCDITLLRSLPNLVLLAPMDQAELDLALRWALDSGRPCALRYPRDMVPPASATPCEPFELGRAVQLRAGEQAAILAYGASATQALAAADQLAAEGIDTAVYNARFAKPLDEELIGRLLADDKPLITVEDHLLAGGFGSAVLETAQANSLDTRRITRLGMPDRFIGIDTRAGQLAQAGIDADTIVQAVKQQVKLAVS